MNLSGAARPAATAAICLSLVLGAVACSSDAAAPSSVSQSSTRTPPNVYEKQREQGVQKLLDKLSASLQSGDRLALDALVDPLASRAFRDSLYQAQSSLGTSPDAPRRGSQLKLSQFAYRVAPNDGPERQLGGELAVRLGDAGSSDSWVSPVNIDYALGGAARPGVAEPTVVLPSVLVFARYEDDWKILGGEELAPDPWAESDQPVRPAEAGPWTFGGLAAADVKTAGGTSAVLSYPNTDKTVESLRKQLPGAVAAVSAFWGDDWPRKAVLMATGDDAEFAALTRTAAGSTSEAAAATVFSRIDKAAKTVAGQRVVFSPAARQLSDPGLGVVLRHELTHVAARLQTAESAPMWLTEGVAEYVGRRGTYKTFDQAAPDLATQVTSGQVPSALPSGTEFSVDDAKARIAYQGAWSFAAFVADKYGEKRLREMYLAVAQGGDTAKVDAALQRTLGENKRDLVAAWGDWLRRQAR